MKRTGLLIAAAMLLVPTAALAAPGLVTTSVSLRAGPGDGFPAVDRIPGGAHVNIHGCLRGDAWCDVSWSDDRGWVSSDELQWLYRNNYVYLSDYYDDIDVPVVPFVLGSYWSTYYSGRPFFHRRAYFDRYWRSHESVAFRTPDRIARARADVREGRGREVGSRTGIEGRNREAFEGRNRTGIDSRAAIDERGRRGVEGRAGFESRNRAGLAGREDLRGREAAHFNGNARVNGAANARAEGRAHFSAAPAARPQMAQPNVNRGPAMNAHAQMAPRAAAPAAMPHAAAPAAMPHAAGGAPGGGGGPGRHH